MADPGAAGWVLQEARFRKPAHRFVDLEVTVRAGSPGVHHAFWNSFVIEVRNLFAEDEIFQQRRAAQTGLERILVVGDRDALIGGETLTA